MDIETIIARYEEIASRKSSPYWDGYLNALLWLGYQIDEASMVNGVLSIHDKLIKEAMAR